MKRRLLVFLSVLFTLITTIALVTACRTDDDGSQEASAEIGEYYCEYNGTEYSLILSEGKTFTMTIAAETMTGKYTLDGEALTLNVKSQSAIAATYRGNEITLTYQETAYKFLKKVEFTVHFETGAGTAVTDQKVVNGKTATKPGDPENGEKVFVGWYTDNNSFRNLYYFSQPVTGDLTLYARYVDMINPEFEVTFDAGEGADAIEPQTTAGHKLYDLPTPVRSDGAEFVGWYVSQFYDGEKLSYLYEAEMTIDEKLTLYAVWNEGKPAFTVGADGIRILNAGVNTRYTIAIKAPGATDPETDSDTAAFYAYDFASKAEGEYEITVSINDATTTLYYHNKALARVSVFEVEESTILFNEVPHAESYLLTVICGTDGHQHIEMPVENRSWSFANCEMPDEGIQFRVKAIADGYVASESETFLFTRTLGDVKNLAIDTATETITWNAVEKAASYFVTVKKAGEEAAVYAEDIGNQMTFSLKTFGEGDYTIEVKALARGWKASAVASITYQKDRLATPKALRLTGETLSWEAVTGAEKYIITIGGTEYPVVGQTNTTLSLADLDIDTTAGPVEVTIRATAANRTDSLESDPIALRAELGELTYQAGQLSWEAVIGIEEYTVTVNDNAPVTVQENTYHVTFDREGVNTLKVSIIGAEGTVLSEKTTTVIAYEISFEAEMESYTEEIPSQYYADGDPLALPTPHLYGYTFESWYTAPGGSEGEGEVYDDTYFNDGQNRTLYATWYGNEHTITFNIGTYGKEAVSSVNVRFGETTKLPVAVSSVDTHAFSGWHYDSESGVALTDFNGNMIRAFARNEDITVYASYVEVFEFKPESGMLTVSKGPGIIQGIVTEVRIPEKYQGAVVERISDFSNCTKLEVIHIPDSITTIILGDTNSAFAGDTALRVIEVYKTSGEIEAKWTSSEGVLIAIDANTSMKTLWYYPIGKNGDYTVPNDVGAIRSGAINGANGLTKLTIGTSVAEIQQNAIMDCDGLLSIEFVFGGDGNLDIRPGALQDCNALAEIKLPARLSENFDPDSIAKLKALKTITVEEGGIYSVEAGLLCKTYSEGSTSGKEVVFAPKGLELGDYTIPSGIVSIGEKAFYEHPNLTGLTIPGWVEKIKAQAFGHITVLTAITFQGVENDPDLTIDAEAFYAGYTSTTGTDTGTNSQVTTLHLPANLVSMGANAFGRYSKLTEVWVEANRAAITYANGAFISKTNNTSYVTTIHIGAKCPAFSFPDVFGKLLSSVEVAQGNNYMKEEEGVIYDTEETSILFYPNEKAGAYVIPDTVTSIGNGTFTNRKQLTAITIPAAVESIGDNAFEGCSTLETVTFVAPEEGAEAKPLTIGNSAFTQCVILHTIELPDRLIKLGKSAFINCDGLTSINLPKDLAEIVLNIDTSNNASYVNIFDNCNNLTTITVDPDNVYFTAKQGVLYRTAELKDGTYVPYEALYCLPGAEGQITVPGTVHRVLKYAFRYIPNVTKITFENTQALTLKADEQAVAATDVTFESYALYGFSAEEAAYNESLKEVVLPEGLTTIGDASTYGPILSFHGLTTITIPSTVASIYPKAFDGCTVLNKLVFAKTPAETEETPLTFEDGTADVNPYGSTYYGAFGKYYASGSNVTDNMLQTDTLVLPGRTAKIGAYALYHAPVKNLTFESAPKSLVIGDNAFNYCKFETFELPEGTTTIGNRAFCYATLPTMNLPDSITTIGENAFADTTFAGGGDTLILPKNLQTLGAYAFGDQYGADYSFTKVDFTKATNLTSIGHHAFANHKKLSSVTFAEATAESPDLTIGTGAFLNGRNLGSITLPANVTQIGSDTVKDNSNKDIVGQVFYGCNGLETVTFATYDVEGAQKSRLSYIGSKTFGNTGITSFTFPESTAAETVVGEQLFVFCSGLTQVTFSTSIHALNSMLKGCGSITKIVIPEGHEHFLADKTKPILYNRDGTVVQYVYSAMTGDFEIGNGSGIEANAFYGQTEITKIVIPAGVQEIGNYAFANCISLKTVEFANGSQLTTIGDYAFQNCWALESINLEACIYLQTLGAYAFQYDTALESNIKLNSTSFESIGKYAFANSGITGIDLAACTGLTMVDQYAFNSTGITSIDLSACSSYTTIANHAFRDMTSLQSVKLPGMTTENDFSTTTVTKMGDYAFASAAFTSLTLKAGITYGKGAFQTCTQLQQVTFSNGNASFELPQAMFSGCSALDTLNFTDLTGLTKIGQETFKGCAFTSVDLSKCTNGSATTMMGQASSFQNCASLTSITLPAKVTKLGNTMFSGTGFTTLDLADFKQITSWGTSCFGDCEELLSVTIPQLGGNCSKTMFKGCSQLETVTFGEGFSKTLGESMFENCTALTTVDLSASTVKALGKAMFKGCSDLTTVKLPTTLNFAGVSAFENCTSLQTIDFSQTAITRFTSGATSNVNTTAVNTFAGCENLQNVVLPESGIVQVGIGVFLNCTNLKNIDLSNVVQFGAKAFMGSGLTGEIALSASITNFANQVFADCPNITAFTGADSGATYKTQNGMIVNAKDNTIMAVPGNMSVSGGTLKLTGDSPISSYAFYGFAAQGVTTLDLSGMTITSLPDYAFYGSSFEEIILPNTVTSIGTYAFAECANLTTVQLPEAITAIPNYAFVGTGITTYDFSAHITKIGAYAFQNSKLQSVTIPATVETIGEHAFDGAAVTSVTFTNDFAVVSKTDAAATGSYLFANCVNLTQVNFGQRTSIGGREFQASGLKDITIPETITQIGDAAFMDSALQRVKFEGNPIGNDSNTSKTLFQGCTELADVTLPEGLLVIPSSMFNKCTSLRTIHIPDTVTDISIQAFEGCSNLTTINIPRDLKNLGHSAFEGCSSLSGDLVLPQGVTFQLAYSGGGNQMNDDIFKGCTSLNSITLSASAAADVFTSTLFSGWTEHQTIRFYESRYEVVAVCGVDWLRSLKANVVYNYTGEEA